MTADPRRSVTFPPLKIEEALGTPRRTRVWPSGSFSAEYRMSGAICDAGNVARSLIDSFANCPAGVLTTATSLKAPVTENRISCPVRPTIVVALPPVLLPPCTLSSPAAAYEVTVNNVAITKDFFNIEFFLI